MNVGVHVIVSNLGIQIEMWSITCFSIAAIQRNKALLFTQYCCEIIPNAEVCMYNSTQLMHLATSDSCRKMGALGSIWTYKTVATCDALTHTS